MMRLTSLPILSLLMAAPVCADSPAKAVPTPLERALLQQTSSPAALHAAASATGRTDEIVRTGKILNKVLEQSENRIAPEIRDQTRMLSDVRRAYDLRLSGDRMGELLVTADKADRFAAYQAATAETLSDDRLAELDDEIFWASFDPDRGDPVQDFQTKEGDLVQIALHPDTREATVIVFAQGDEDEAPFTLALPTEWVVDAEETAEEAVFDPDDDLLTPVESDPDGQDFKTEGPKEDDFGDDLFASDVPVPQPIADPDHDPKILTPDQRDETQQQLNGLWDMSGFLDGDSQTWFITADIGTDNAIAPDQNLARQELGKLRDDLDALEGGSGSAHVWRNYETGEKVRQARYKRLDIDVWEYIGEETNEDEVARLKEQIAAAEEKRSSGVARIPTTVQGFDQLAGKGGAIRVRQLGPCGGVMDASFFDGLNLGVRDLPQQRCEMQRALPEAVKSQLVGNVSVPWVAMFRIIPDPRSDRLLMRGQSWGGFVHYDQYSLKVTAQSGPSFYANPMGTRPKEDENTLLSGSAMGADHDERL